MASIKESYLISLEKWVLEHQKEIELAVEIIGGTCEILADTVGQINPLFQYIFLGLAKLLQKQNDDEDKRFSEHFQKINQKLEQIYDDFEKMDRLMSRSALNQVNFKYEAQINFQYKAFSKIFTTELNKEKQIKEFVRMFENAGGEQNLNDLYDQITGDTMSGRRMLDVIVDTEKRSRRAVEEFCAQLKKLFLFGIVALMGYTAIKEDNDGEDVVKKWQARMEDVEKRMKAAVDECVNNFHTQAKKDIETQFKELDRNADSKFTKSILDALVKKFDWVSWSVRVYTDGIKFQNFGLVRMMSKMLTRKQCHVFGPDTNYFNFDPCDKNIKILVSFTANPKSLNKKQIQDQIQREKGDMKSVAESLHRSFPDCLVHTVRLSNKMEEANNFDSDNFYHVSNTEAYIYMHSL